MTSQTDRAHIAIAAETLLQQVMPSRHAASAA
jgi:hypothetical protein